MHCRRLLRIFLLALLGVTGAATAASAHPHVWIYNTVTVIFEDGQVVALQHRWEFDEFFSAYMIEAYDVDGSGTFDAEELRLLKDGGFDNIAEYGYFTHLDAESGTPAIAGARKFDAAIEGEFLVYEFTTPLARAFDPASGMLQIGVYDSSYYIDITPAADAGTLVGAPAADCRLRRGEDREHPIYYGLVNPPVLRLTCGAS